MRVAMRSLGWLLIAAGALVALYLVYSLYWTGRGTAVAQDRLLEEITLEQERFSLDLEVDDPDDDPVIEDDETGDDVDGPATPEVDVGAALAVMEFHRPGEDAAVVIDTPVVVVEGVTDDALKKGPGRYPGTAYPGRPGNFAVAGHRTTYGAPFWNLDQLGEGDEVHVTDRDGTTWIYAVTEQRIVQPSDISVLEPDPLGTGEPTLTLTTCHPRWSQRERLIVFAELVDQQVAEA